MSYAWNGFSKLPTSIGLSVLKSVFPCNLWNFYVYVTKHAYCFQQYFWLIFQRCLWAFGWCISQALPTEDRKIQLHQPLLSRNQIFDVILFEQTITMYTSHYLFKILSDAVLIDRQKAGLNNDASLCLLSEWSFFLKRQKNKW